MPFDCPDRRKQLASKLLRSVVGISLVADLGKLNLLVERHILFASIKVLDVAAVGEIWVRVVGLTAAIIVARCHPCWVVAAVVSVIATTWIAVNTGNLRGHDATLLLNILNVSIRMDCWVGRYVD